MSWQGHIFSELSAKITALIAQLGVLASTTDPVMSQAEFDLITESFPEPMSPEDLSALRLIVGKPRQVAITILSIFMNFGIISSVEEIGTRADSIDGKLNTLDTLHGDLNTIETLLNPGSPILTSAGTANNHLGMISAAVQVLAGLGSVYEETQPFLMTTSGAKTSILSIAKVSIDPHIGMFSVDDVLKLRISGEINTDDTISGASSVAAVTVGFSDGTSDSWSYGVTNIVNRTTSTLSGVWKFEAVALFDYASWHAIVPNHRLRIWYTDAINNVRYGGYAHISINMEKVPLI